MTYREKLAKIVDLEADRLLRDAMEGHQGMAIPNPGVNLERLERLCRCAKILADEEPGDESEVPVDEKDLLSIAES